MLFYLFRNFNPTIIAAKLLMFFYLKNFNATTTELLLFFMKD